LGVSGRETLSWKGREVDGIKEAAHKGEMHVSRPAVDTLFVQLSGNWMLQSKVPTAAELQRQLEAETGVRRLVVEARELTGWDSGLVTFLRNGAGVCAQRQIAFHRDGLPEGVRRLLDLAAAVPERQGARCQATRVFARRRKIQAVQVGEDMGDAQGEGGGASWADRRIQR
jgi:phospholipid/cholesterol/gamma-HCH transport system permease protein